MSVLKVESIEQRKVHGPIGKVHFTHVSVPTVPLLTVMSLSVLSKVATRVGRKRCLSVLATPLLANRNTRSVSTGPAYPGHIHLNWFENAFLFAGSGLMALMDPYRGGKPYTIGL